MMQLAILGALLFTVILTACGDSADSTTRYEVAVLFNTSVTQEDLTETNETLQSYDEALQFLIQELFPPIGRAVLTTDASDFCSTIEMDLEAKTYVRDVTCREWEEPDASESPDEPVEDNN